MRRSGLRKGDRVIVRSAGEILATLDETGARDGMPFMPEMVELCGRRYTVDRRAEKICDTITNDLRSRRLANTVLLEDLRCDGGGHGGCQAECRLYWHEAWLRREEDDGAPTEPAPVDDEATRALLDRVSRGARSNGDGNARYRCQATEMFTASLPLSTADPRSYARELSSGNVPLGKFVHVMARATVMQTLYHLDKLPMPPLKGDSATSPPSTPLDLRPGDWVRVKSKEEIRKMLTEKGANRGLWFDREMVAFCGRVMQVRGRVTRIVDERTGEMIELARDCIKLEGGVCSGEFSTGRWFCPREIYSYWRECWLERIDAPAVLPPADHASTTDASAPLNG